jgi:A/G-specific adenine glycosylase
MELGALICTPRSPHCLTCPVRTHCRAQAVGMQEQLPVKQKKKKQRLEHMVAALVVHEGRVLIRQRPDTGLLAKLFEFPNVQWSPDRESAPETIAKHLYTTYGIRSETEAALDKVKHTFTHLIWDISVYDMRIVAGVNRTERSSSAPFSSVSEPSPEEDIPSVRKRESLWVDIHDLDAFTFSVSHQKIKRQLKKRYHLQRA